MCMFGGSPEIPKPAPIPAPPQAPQVPEPSVFKKANKTVNAGYGKSSGSTFLTGAEGIKDSDLQLGKNTLLGG